MGTCGGTTNLSPLKNITFTCIASVCTEYDLIPRELENTALILNFPTIIQPQRNMSSEKFMRVTLLRYIVF